MKAVIQRVVSASVAVEGNEISAIDQGLLILLGVKKNDTLEDLDYITKKTVGLRIFTGDNKKMDLSIQDVSGGVLVVSQFTLCSETRKGRRPSFINAAPPEEAKNMYEQFCEKLQDKNIPVQKGQFGAIMDVKLINNGPVTIILDSENR